MGATAAIIGAVAAVASAANSMGVFGGQGGGAGAPKMPTPTPLDTTQDSKQMNRALLPGVKANAATNLGGGISPQFLSGLLDNQTGQPGGGMDILGEISKSLGAGGGAGIAGL